MTTNDQLIACGRLTQLQDVALCTQLFSHVLAQLSQFLGAEVTPEIPFIDVPGNGFCLPISCTGMQGQGLQFKMKGIISGRESTEQDGLQFGATLFSYLGGKRLASLAGESILDVEYVPQVECSGEWRVVGWFKDQYGEYEAYDHLE